MTKPIAIVDCNNFYASCERVFNPKMQGRPVVVLSNHDGMIIARSAEAKAVGIKMGEPLFKIKDLIERKKVAVFSSNYALYGDMSHRVMSTLEQFSPDVEIYSIDEAFMKLDGFERYDLAEYGKEICETVEQWTGIPVSIGIAETKTLAKIANRVAKNNSKFRGVLNLYNSDERKNALLATDVADVWGVGRQYTKLLYRNGIRNAYELSLAKDKWIQKHMTITGLKTVHELRGIPCIEHEEGPPANKAIIVSRSFSHLVTSISEIREALAFYATRAGEKLRKQKSAASLMTIFLRTNPFKQSPQYHNGVVVKLPMPTDSTIEMLAYCDKGLKQIFRKGYKYHKVGIMLTGIVPLDKSQIALFDTEDRIKMAKITEVFDKINSEMGAGTLFFGTAGTKKEWITKAEMKSPRYTTRWDELPEAKADDLDEQQTELF
jgi:DNA polymerase V